MAVTDKINQRVLQLPEPLQSEVLDFVEFLLSKVEHAQQNDQIEDLSDVDWSNFSLTMAMRGMEEEEGPEYTLDDLKETF